MLSVDDITQAIVTREGGFVNDPDDPGGATKFGVTIGTLRTLGLDKTGDGKVTVADVQALTKDDAADIFKKHYYFRPKIDQLPQAVQASVYDMYVNAGDNAVRILQRLVREMGIEITVDGDIGPKTIGACEQAAALAPNHFADAYGIARRNYYYALADRNAKLRKYARTMAGTKGGWIKRAEEFMADRYHLTQAQHSERTKAWS